MRWLLIVPGPTFRHEEFKDYKATRKKMPDEYAVSSPNPKTGPSDPGYEMDGYEADDVIGTIACQAADRGLDVLIFTGDRDAFQLADERVRIMIIKGIGETEKSGRRS